MNKKNIVENAVKSMKLSIEDKEIITAIELAKREWENAENYFQFVKEPKMVDYAIYLQNAASVRYMYLLRMAKDNKISLGYYNSMKEIYTEIHINASPSIVWNILTDFDKFGKWNPFIPKISGHQKGGSELQIYINLPNSNGMKFKTKI